MAVINCPKCPTALKIPDGATGQVKCPKCQFLFPIPAAPASPSLALPPLPSDEPPPPARTATSKFEEVEDKFEVVDTPANKRAYDDDDDDSGPRRRSSRYDDDDDDDDRSRRSGPSRGRSRDDDDDDDDDDRSRRSSRSTRDDDRPSRGRSRHDDDDDDRQRPAPRKKRRYDEGDDEDEDTNPRKASAALLKGRANARIGMLLVTISSWLYFGLYAMLALGLFVLLVGVVIADPNPRVAPKAAFVPADSDFVITVFNGILLLIGLIGLANWVGSLVGFSFCIGGPEGTRVPAITSTGVAGFHFLLLAICFLIAFDELRVFGRLSGMEAFAAGIFASTMLLINTVLPGLIYASRALGTEYFLLVLTAVFEIIRLFLSLGTIRTLALSVKNHAAAKRAHWGVIVAVCVLVGGILLSLLVTVMLRGTHKPKTLALLIFGWLFLLALGYAVMLLFPALCAMSTRRSLGKTTR